MGFRPDNPRLDLNSLEFRLRELLRHGGGSLVVGRSVDEVGRESLWISPMNFRPERSIMSSALFEAQIDRFLATFIEGDLEACAQLIRQAEEHWKELLP